MIELKQYETILIPQAVAVLPPVEPLNFENLLIFFFIYLTESRVFPVHLCNGMRCIHRERENASDITWL